MPVLSVSVITAQQSGGSGGSAPLYQVILSIIGAVLLTTIVAGLVPLVAARLVRPRLRIEGCDFHDEGGNWRVFRLVVTNRGGRPARGVIGQLSVVPLPPVRVASSGLITEQTFWAGGSSLNDVPLFWFLPDRPSELVMLRGVPQRLEIGRARVHSSLMEVAFTIPSLQRYEPPLIVFSGTGFAFLVRVGAENARVAHKTGYVRWSEFNSTMELSERIIPEFKLPPSVALPRRWQLWRKGLWSKVHQRILDGLY
jgi:hypothetical protein